MDSWVSTNLIEVKVLKLNIKKITENYLSSGYKIFAWVHVQTEDVISMSGVESLRVIGRIVDHSHRSNMIDNLPSVSVIKVVTAIIATVTET